MATAFSGNALALCSKLSTSTSAVFQLCWQKALCMSFAVMKPALHLIWWQARRREVMRQQRIEEEAVADAAEREYQVTSQQ